MSHESKTNETVVVIANAVELGVKVIRNISGVGMATKIDGNPVDGPLLSTLMGAKIQSRLSRYMKSGV
jgi:hypothetical protein